MKLLSKPAYLAGKLAYLEGIPEDAIAHVKGETRNLWLAGRADMRAELMSLRPPAERLRRRVPAEPGNHLLHELQGLPGYPSSR